MKKKYIYIWAISFCFLATTNLASAQQVPLSAPPSQQNGTPNISIQSSIWSQTSPQTQIVLGIGDLVLLGSVQLVEDPEFREASRKYRLQSRMEANAKSKHDDTAREMTAEEKTLEELQTQRSISEAEVRTQDSLIRTKVTNLEKNRKILTSVEKETKLKGVKERLIELNTQAMRDHRGKIEQPDDLYAALPTGEQQEVKELMREYNSMNDMPDVNREQKVELVKQAEDELSAARQTRDMTLKNMQVLQQKISQKTVEIEKLKPVMLSTESAWVKEREIADGAKAEMMSVARRKGAKRVAYKVVRFGGDLIFGLDIGSRIVYYFIAQEDPGWFPFGRILIKL